MSQENSRFCIPTFEPNGRKLTCYHTLNLTLSNHLHVFFRPSKEVYAIAEDAIKIGAKVLWLQLGIRDEKAKDLMEKNNIEYIDNKCTKMEYQKYFLKIRPAFPALSN